jgi:hypothetical protein
MAIGAVVARILTQYSDKGSKAANKDINKLGKQFDAFAKKSAKAFGIAAGAAAAFALKIGKDAVQAAMADQKSQALLANSLKNTTGATNAAIASVESYISNLQLQVGVTDDELRPSLAKLAAVTGSVSAAQGLLGTALDVSAFAQVDLSTATNAITKALQGNFRGLQNLVKGIDLTTLKSKDLVKIFEEVEAITKGSAATRANTLEFRLSILRIRFGEILEEVGYKLLPVLEKFAQTIQTKVLPQLEAFIATNGTRLVEAFTSASDAAVKLIGLFVTFVTFVSNNMGLIEAMAKLIAGMFVVGRIAAFATVIGKLTAAFVALRTAAGGAAIATAFATGGASLASTAAALVAVGGVALVTGLKVAGNNARSKKAQTEAGLAGYQGAPGASDIAGLKGFKSENIKTPTIDANLQSVMNALLKSQNSLNNAKGKELTTEQKIVNQMLKKYDLSLMTSEIEAKATAASIQENLNRQAMIAKSPTVSLAAQGDGSAGGNSIINSGTPNISVSITTPHGTADDYVVDITNKQNQLAKRAGAINILHRTR